MAKPVPIPSLKKPSNALPVDAMAAFVSGPESAASAAVAPAEPIALVSAPSSSDNADTSPTVVSIDSGRPSSAPRAKASAKKSGRRVETRADGSVSRKVTVYLEPDLDKQLSIHAVTNDIDRSDVVAEALSQFLRRNGR